MHMLIMQRSLTLYECVSLLILILNILLVYSTLTSSNTGVRVNVPTLPPPLVPVGPIPVERMSCHQLSVKEQLPGSFP